MHFSHEKISSFVGDVRPLQLLGESNLSHADIKWSVDDPDLVGIRTYEGDTPYHFTNGAMLTLKKSGSTTVTATLDGVAYTCPVEIRERATPAKNQKLNYYIGDMHDHTTNTHVAAEYAVRTEERSIDYINYIKEKNNIDFGVISDHACLIPPKHFFDAFTEVEATDMEPILFAGAECEITVVEEDRFGIPYKNSGEIVCINADNRASARAWQPFFDAFSTSPFAVGTFAHPFVMGISVPGIWDFHPERNNGPELLSLIKAAEMGDGSDRGSQMLHECLFTLALDNGFRLTTTCSSDSHGPVWGYDALPGKTVIMATEKSREAFLDALLNRRFYGCESGNVQLYYTVNGEAAPADIPAAERYNVHVELSYFNEDPTTAPKLCQVISDGGVPICEVSVTGDTFDFTVVAPKATYLFLRLVDPKGRKTWGTPVYTDYKKDAVPARALRPIDKTGFTVTELESGLDASVLANGDPRAEWHSNLTTASYLIDMGKEREIAAFGHYTPYLHVKQMRAAGIVPNTVIAGLTARYRLSAGNAPDALAPLFEHRVRHYSSEEVRDFAPVRARYVRFDVLSTAGKESGWPQHAAAPIILAELSLFEEEKA